MYFILRCSHHSSNGWFSVRGRERKYFKGRGRGLKGGETVVMLYKGDPTSFKDGKCPYPPWKKKITFLVRKKRSNLYNENTELPEGCGASTLAQGHSLSSTYLEREINFCEVTRVSLFYFLAKCCFVGHCIPLLSVSMCRTLF